MFANTLESDSVAILRSAILDCQNQDELTACALQIHQVCAPHSDEERELIVKCAAKGIQLDMLEMELDARRRALESKWQQN